MLPRSAYVKLCLLLNYVITILTITRARARVLHAALNLTSSLYGTDQLLGMHLRFSIAFIIMVYT